MSVVNSSESRARPGTGGGQLDEGPVATPAQDAIGADAKALAATWDAWRHRKLASLKRTGIDDIEAGPVLDATMYRALGRNGLCLPVGYSGDVRQTAGGRREAFIEPRTRRNRLWQAKFSEFETVGAGTWNLGGVVDDWAKVNLATTVSVTKATRYAVAFFETALVQVEVLFGATWVEDLTDPLTGEIGTLKLVTHNGPCFKSRELAAWVASKRHLVHTRARRRAPWTNGKIERFFKVLKYDRLYRSSSTARPQPSTFPTPNLSQ